MRKNLLPKPRIKKNKYDNLLLRLTEIAAGIFISIRYELKNLKLTGGDSVIATSNKALCIRISELTQIVVWSVRDAFNAVNEFNRNKDNAVRIKIRKKYQYRYVSR